MNKHISTLAAIAAAAAPVAAFAAAPNADANTVASWVWSVPTPDGSGVTVVGSCPTGQEPQWRVVPDNGIYIYNGVNETKAQFEQLVASGTITQPWKIVYSQRQGWETTLPVGTAAPTDKIAEGDCVDTGTTLPIGNNGPGGTSTPTASATASDTASSTPSASDTPTETATTTPTGDASSTATSSASDSQSASTTPSTTATDSAASSAATSTASATASATTPTASATTSAPSATTSSSTSPATVAPTASSSASTSTPSATVTTSASSPSTPTPTAKQTTAPAKTVTETFQVDRYAPKTAAQKAVVAKLDADGKLTFREDQALWGASVWQFVTVTVPVNATPAQLMKAINAATNSKVGDVTTTAKLTTGGNVTVAWLLGKGATIRNPWGSSHTVAQTFTARSTR